MNRDPRTGRFVQAPPPGPWKKAAIATAWFLTAMVMAVGVGTPLPNAHWLVVVLVSAAVFFAAEFGWTGRVGR
jgi:hypothetical protein